MKALLVDPVPQVLVDTMRRQMPAGHVLEAVADDSEEELRRQAADADVFLVVHRTIDAAALAHAPNLRFIQRFGVGYDNIDVDAARAAGVLVAYAPGANAAAVAEHAVMLMLAVLRRLAYSEEATRRGEWPFQEMLAARVRDLDGAAVGLVGMGATAKAVAARLRPFGSAVSYFSRRRLDPDVEHDLGVPYTPLPALLAGSDVVSLHLPLTDETRGMFGRDALAQMKPGAVLVNTARGALVDEAALHDAVAFGHLFGAGLDVLADEAAGGNPFADLPNVVVTPHYAGASAGAQARIMRTGIANVMRFLAGERPEHLVERQP